MKRQHFLDHLAISALAITASAFFVAGCPGPSKPPVQPVPQPGQPSTAPVYLPVPADPVLSYNIWFQVGSQNDPAGKEGLAWLTGEMIANGSTTQNTYQQIVAKLFPMAASYDVRVDREMTTLRARAHRDHGAAFGALFADAYLRPAFSAADFERIRNRGLSYLEKALRYAQDEELGKAAFYGFVFDGTSYRHPVNGTVEGLKSITLDDVKAFYNKYYTRDRTVFGLGGGYDDATSAAFTATRDQLPPDSGVTPAPAPQPAAFEGRHVMLVSKPGADASISFGFPIDLRRGDKDYYALWVATSWLGEHRNSSSHLYKVIRQARGLNYGDYAYIEAFPEGGFRQMPPTNVARRQQLFEVWIRTLPNDKAVFALRAALRELRKLVDNGMTDEQFELTRTFLRKYIRHFAPTTRGRLGYAIDDRFYGIEQSHLEQFVKMMDELTLSDVNRAIKTHLQYKNLKIAMVTGEAESIKSALVTAAPTKITYDVSKPEEVLREDEEIAVEPLDIAADRVTVVPVDTIFQR